MSQTIAAWNEQEGAGIIRTVYDPACGTGGMLAIAEECMKALNPKIRRGADPL